MRKLIMPVLAAMSLLTACYFALPFWTALELKRAIRNGDVATVEARVEWDSLRTSLRQSLTEQAPNEVRRRFSRIPFIQKYAEKFAASYSEPVVNKMVDSFGRPDGGAFDPAPSRRSPSPHARSRARAGSARPGPTGADLVGSARVLPN